MAFHQQATGLDDVLGLAVVQADGLDVFGQAFDTQGVDCRWGIGYGEELGSRLVDSASVDCAERITAISSSNGEE